MVISQQSNTVAAVPADQRAQSKSNRYCNQPFLDLRRLVVGIVVPTTKGVAHIASCSVELKKRIIFRNHFHSSNNF